MKDEITPEERLLRLIRGGPKKPSQRAEREAEKSYLHHHQAVLPESEAALKKRTKWFLPQATFIENLSTVKSATKIIGVVLFILAVYLVIDSIKPTPLRIDLNLSPAEKSQEGELPLVPKPYSYYSEKIGTRELFKPSLIKEKEKEEKRVTLEDLIAPLALIGIISGEHPQAIIEDKKTNKTHFLEKGGKVGQIEVEEIFEDKVILNYGEQKAELVL